MRINQVEPTFANITDNFDGFGASPDGLGTTIRTIDDLPRGGMREVARLGHHRHFLFQIF